MNLAGILAAAARDFPERPAVIEAGREVSYRQLLYDSRRLAAGLSGLGLGPGGRAAICLPGGARWLAAYFGVLATGGQVATFFHGLPGPELRRLLEDSRPRVLLAGSEQIAALGGRNLGFGCTVVGPGGEMDWEQLAARGGEAGGMAQRQPGDVAAILYTGGTTGRPKGAMLTHNNLLASAGHIAWMERNTPQDRALCFLPLNHVFGQVHICLATILSAGCLVMLPAFEQEAALEAIALHGVTKLYAVPTIYARLLQVEGLKQRLRGVRYCFSAAASMAGEVVRRWRAATGLDIFEAYGMTESAAMVTYNHHHRHKVGSVGTPVGTVEVSIRDQEGRTLPAGDEGEIWVRGPNVFSGYLNQPGETAAALQSGWFRSGDVGRLDHEGYLFIVDRIKDLIITGGENVYPREVEELLYQRPEVAECAVIGLPDAEYGERVTAYIVARPGQAIDPAELKAWLKQRLAGFKVPKEFVTVDDLPKSGAGKILKRELKRRLRKDNP
jgi:long-chain acyl-CoA synthetase